MVAGQDIRVHHPGRAVAVTSDMASSAPVSHPLTCEVDGELVQEADTGDLVFTPAALVSYISSIITLVPGHLIATGTPGGVGHARQPPRYLTSGAEVITRIEGIGECRNTCRDEKQLVPTSRSLP